MKFWKANIEHSTFNIQHPKQPQGVPSSMLDVGCWMLGVFIRRLARVGVACVTLAGAGSSFADTNSASLEDDPFALLPPHPEIPPTFLEQYGVLVAVGAVCLLALATFAIWLWVRPKAPVVVPPATQARRELESLRQMPEDGAMLSRVSQIVRRYFAAAFELPPGELTTAEFSRAVAARKKRVGPELAAKAEDLLRQCDEQKFAPAAPPQEINAASRALELVDLAETRRTQLREAAQAAGKTESRA